MNRSNPSHPVATWARRARMAVGALGVATLVATPAIGLAAEAPAWPSKPIRLVVPFPPGGTPDAYGRALAQQLQVQLGQPVVVDNRAGANGVIGMDAVAKAAPDGTTFLYTTLAFAINPGVHRKLPFDARKDFVPVTNVASGEGYLVLVNPAVPAKNLKELIALASNPAAPLNFGSAGIGNSTHLAAELFNSKAGTKMAHVPYKGLSPAITALLGGEIQVLFASPTATIQFVKTGRLRALGYTGATRWPLYPDIPAVAEQVPGYEVSGSWHGLFAPARTPPDIVLKLQAEVAKAVAAPSLRDLLKAGGYDPVADTPAAFQKYVDSEIGKYTELARAINLKID